MATYTDDFNRADGALAAPWVGVQNGFLIASNQIHSASSGKNLAALTGETFDADQVATIEVAAVSGYDFAGTAVRMDASANGYVGLAHFGDGRLYCYRVDAGVWTSLGFRSASFIATDTLAIGIVGSTITLYKNGVAQGATFTDATHTAGAPGVAYDRQDSNASYIDNFSATGYAAGDTLTVTEASATYGDPVTLNTSITDATDATVSDGTTTLNMVSFAGTSGAYTAGLPATPYGSAGLDPTATWTVTVTNGTATATDTITSAPLTGYSELIATTQSGSLMKGDWGYSGVGGWDNSVPVGSVLWYDVPAGATPQTDGSLTVTEGTFTGGEADYIVWDSGDRKLYQLTLTYDSEGAVVTANVVSRRNKAAEQSSHSMAAVISSVF